MEQELDRTTAFFRFEDLRIYTKVLDYIAWVYLHTNKFPENGNVKLADTYFTSALAIALHIAEGSARNKPQFIHYLKMAKSAVRECVVHNTLALKMSYLTEHDAEESRQQLMEMTKMLGALIGSLQRSAGIVDTDED